MRPTLPPSGILFGGDYNPEQWPESVWQEDVRLMRDAGVNVVSLAIFSWAKLEPQPGVYEFDWLQRVMDLLHAHDIRVCLSTATASTPAWFVRAHPESLPVDAAGTRLAFGSRQHVCPNSPDYRRASDQLITALARRLGSHPAVILWHINNELGCHTQECHCDTCAAAFRDWLRQRYATLDTLNDTWGTAFWSQSYGAWEEISTPRKMPAAANPCQRLDYLHFMSDSLRGVLSAEIAAVRAVLPEARVTTNGVGSGLGWVRTSDYFAWYRHCDVAALDCYPDPADDPLVSARQSALCHDLYRSFKQGQPFLLMEQATSQINSRPVNVLKRPGQMRALSLGAVARGADGVMFFQWRASRAGVEKYHGAMVPHIGPDSRIHREVQSLGHELRALAPVAGARTPARTALIAGWRNRTALELGAKPAVFRYEDILHDWHGPLVEHNIACDIVEPGQSLDGYDVVLAPALYQLTAPQADLLRTFVHRGGTLVVGYFSGVVDDHERIALGGYPALLTEVLGLVVEEWQPIPPGQQNGLRHGEHEVPCTFFSEVVQLQGAQAVATFTRDFFAGSPAITRHSFGKGQAIYVATRPDPAFSSQFLRNIVAEVGVTAPLATPAGVEASVRETDTTQFLFVINHDTTPATVSYADWTACPDLLFHGTPAPGTETLAPFSARVLTRPRAATTR